MSWETMWQFKTANFTIRAQVCPDYDVDASFDETGETQANLDSGLWQAFGTRVQVLELGSDSLWGSIYEKPREFFTDHRSADPMNRNCTIMRAKHGEKTSICHYFPGMVAEAIAQARAQLKHYEQLAEDIFLTWKCALDVDSVYAAVNEVSPKYANNIRADITWARGRRVRFVLRARDSHKRGARMSASGRHTIAVSWEAHRDVMRALFRRDPEARIQSALAVYRGVDDFERTYEATGHKNVGSTMFLVTIREGSVF